MRPVKSLIRLRECAGWSESSPSAHVCRYFYDVATHVVMNHYVCLPRLDNVESIKNTVVIVDNFCISIAILCNNTGLFGFYID